MVLTEQQQAFAEQQAQALQQAVEAQRLFAEQRVQQHSRLAEQFREGVLDPLSRDPLAGFDPFSTDAVTDDRPAPGYVQQMIDQSDAAYEKAKADSQARREAFEKRVQERREAMQQRVRTSAPAPQEPPPASI